MKVLFAVNNENISESIIKLYQKQYREIISGKNVYYFNAIIKELQRDQTYDCVIISEDLEPYSNNNYNAIDTFLFEQLDKISDEATAGKGGDIPIIFIATDRRSKSDALLSKLFSIGIYNALLGTDRNIPEICKLLNKPRNKKEAKVYYRIESEEVTYQAESEDTVSETEIRNILTHYKKLGKNTERYVESFNNIAAQYNDAQLRIITKFLPISVKAVLEAESPKYQSIMTFGEGTYKKPDKEEKKHDLKIGFIETHSDKGRPVGPVVIPSSVNKDNAQRLTNSKINTSVKRPDNTIKMEKQADDDFENNDEFSDILDSLHDELDEINNNREKTDTAVQTPKRGRGRPKKQQLVPDEIVEIKGLESKKRGRPKKTTQQMEEVNEEAFNQDNILPGFEETENNNEEDYILQGFNDINDLPDSVDRNNVKENNNQVSSYNSTSAFAKNQNSRPQEQQNDYTQNTNMQYNREQEHHNNFTQNNDNLYNRTQEQHENYIQNTNANRGESDFTRFLSRDKKIVAFVGTTKAGTSFLINNIADYLAKTGIKVAILDVTLNRNSYYIYTKNEETLRRKAQNCIENLEHGNVEGIEVNKNLSVFTSIPGKKEEVYDYEAIITSLAKQYSLILLDCDFDTPVDYFKLAQEIYLVQSMDILTIQPLTAFLRDLQSENALDIEKLKIVINKVIKVRGLTANAIIGGMSCYNDPQMTYMKELFNKDKMNPITISFDEDVLARYLSGMVDCEVNINGYSKQFLAELKVLSDTVYPLVNSKFKTDYTKNNKFANTEEYDNNFPSSMNNTLDKMKSRFK